MSSKFFIDSPLSNFIFGSDVACLLFCTLVLTGCFQSDNRAEYIEKTTAYINGLPDLNNEQKKVLTLYAYETIVLVDSKQHDKEAYLRARDNLFGIGMCMTKVSLKVTFPMSETHANYDDHKFSVMWDEVSVLNSMIIDTPAKQHKFDEFNTWTGKKIFYPDLPMHQSCEAFLNYYTP